MKHQRYCCYRHYITGKVSKDSTYCYSHVPLGVINPVPGYNSIQKNDKPVNINFEGERIRIKNRTHDYNQIQRKQSMPNRLVNPKVYIQKIVDNNLYGSNSTFSTKRLQFKNRCLLSQYDIIHQFYKKIASGLKNPTTKQLKDVIIQFMVRNREDSSDKDLLLKHDQFKQLFSSQIIFSDEQIQNFWEIAFNDRRFLSTKFQVQKPGQFISMKAFIHNFDKFYLSQQTKFTNMFSEVALKQRVIDIRHFLHLWYVSLQLLQKNNIYYLINMKEQKKKQFTICSYLKRYEGDNKIKNQSLSTEMLDLIQKRNYEFQKLRVIAKFIYELTDNKFLTFQKLRHSIAAKIESQSILIEQTMKIIQNFLQIKQLKDTDKFPITDIFQFMKLQNNNQFQYEMMAKMLRRLIKYLYFQKQQSNNNLSESIIFCPQTLTFKCENLINLSPLILQQFYHYQKVRSQMIIETINNNFMLYLQKQIMQTHVFRIIEQNNLQNQIKIKIVQCNFIAQGIKRYLRRCNLVYFYILNNISQQFQQICSQGRLQPINQLLVKMKNLDNQSVQVKKSIKYMFTLHELQSNQIPLVSPNKKMNEQDAEKYKQAFNNYKKTIETKSLKLKYNQQNKGDRDDDIFGIDKMVNLNNNQLSSKNPTLDLPRDIFQYNIKSSYNVCYKDCCSQISSQTQASITAVQNLQAKLEQMLNW